MSENPAYIPKEPKEEPLFSNEVPQPVFDGERTIKEEEKSDDGRFSTLSSPTHSAFSFSRSMAPGPVEIKEEEMDAEDEIKKEPKKDKGKTPKPKDSLLTAEEGNIRRSSRLPKNDDDFANDSDGDIEPVVKKPRSDSAKSRDNILYEGNRHSMATEVIEKDGEARGKLDRTTATSKITLADVTTTRPSDILNKRLEASAVEINQYMRELEAKAAEFEQYKLDSESEKKKLVEEKKEREEESKKKVNDLTSQLEEERKDREKNCERIKDLTSKLAQYKVQPLMPQVNTEIMIRAKFTDVSKLPYEGIYSEPTEHAGLTWRMSVFKQPNSTFFCLEGVKKSAVDWFCPVIAEFLMFSQKSKELVHREESKLIFDADNSKYSVANVRNTYLFADEKGFLNDDSIVVAVALRVFPRSIHQILEMRIDAKLTEISKFRGGIYSQPTEFAGVTWKISARHRSDSLIWFYLDGKKENAVGWWCAVIAEFHLISQKSKKIVHRREKKLIYDADNSSHWLKFFHPKDLFNEKMGIVKDDSIVVAVSLRVVPTD